MSHATTSAAKESALRERRPAEPGAPARAYEVCVAKTRVTIARLADAPKSGAFERHGHYFDFKEKFFDIGNWTSSFFTGMALLAFESTRDGYFLEQTERLAGVYREKITTHRRDTMHDLGFLYMLYSVALHRLAGNPEHRATGLLAAEELARRFHPVGGFIQAWGRMDDKKSDYAGLAIIDCMMNLPLLFWAARETGQARYREIAVRHADTTLARFVRADDSVFHSYRFDPATGAPVGGDNYCGFNIDSHWARGTTWAIYGFALAYRYTGDGRYLEVSRRLATRFVQLLDDEVVPLWDFKLPAAAAPIRDSSAAAIAVCALDELGRHLPGEKTFASAAAALLARLCSRDYLDDNPACMGILKQAQIGDGVGKARVAYASWGDYYFMEALARRLHPVVGFW